MAIDVPDNVGAGLSANYLDQVVRRISRAPLPLTWSHRTTNSPLVTLDSLE